MTRSEGGPKALHQQALRSHTLRVWDTEFRRWVGGAGRRVRGTKRPFTSESVGGPKSDRSRGVLGVNFFLQK